MRIDIRTLFSLHGTVNRRTYLAMGLDQVKREAEADAAFATVAVATSMAR